MRISFLIYSLGPGGAEKTVSYLLNHLAKKYEIFLVLMNSTIFYKIPENVKVFYIENSNPREIGLKKFLKLPFLALKYKKVLKENKIDISISFMNRPNYINVISKLFKSKIKTIISERISPIGEYGNLSIKNFFNRILIKFLYPKSDLCIPNSKWIKFELIEKFKIPEKKINIIYNSIDIIKINKLKKENNINFKNKKFIFINIGRLEPQKNHIMLIESFYRANLDAELWLIGEGFLKKSIEKKILELKLKDKIKILGKQKNPYKFLVNAHCFVFSSNYEGFPNVILEALACGLPIISTDCRSGPREILAPDTDFRYVTNRIELAEYGILVPVGNVDKFANAMKLIFKNKKLRDNYKKKAIERAKDFDINKIIKKWEEILND